MKFASIIAKTALTLLAASAALAADLDAVQAHRLRVLYDRVYETLIYRYEAAGLCVLKTRSLDAVRFRFSLAPLLKPAKTAPTAGDVQNLLAAYRESEALRLKASPCRKHVRAADRTLADREQEPFETALALARGASLAGNAILSPLSSLGGALSSRAIAVESLIAALHPFCATKVVASLDGTFETNPCFAGDRLVTGGLEGSKIPAVTAENLADGFLLKFEAAVRAAPPGGGVELLSAYPLLGKIRDFDARKRLLALLAFFHASSKSNAGYVDGFGDHFWRDSLKAGGDARGALARYLEWKNRKDRFSAILAEVSARKLRLSLNGHDWTAANRHEYMSAFLACHFRGIDEDVAAELIPLFLGYAYEGKDFVSHIEGGVGWKGSIRNFYEDTARYHRGMELGYSFCWD